MRALVRTEYGGPEVLRVAERPTPRPGRGRVRVRVETAGVTMGDHHAMTGLPYAGRLAFGLFRPRRPELGMDLAGTVDALGPGVEGLELGDRVFGVGEFAFAEYAIAKAELLVPTPGGVSAETAAGTPFGGMTALDALDAAGVEAGQRVLVTGAGGGVGTMVVQLAVARGARVTGVCSTSKLDLVRSLGADRVVDYTVEEPPAGEADAVIDFGGARPVPALAAFTHPGGVVILGGGENDGRWLGGAARMFQRAPRRGPRVRGLLSLARRRSLETLAAALAEGSLSVPIDEVLPLDHGAEAFARLGEGRVRGRIVLRVAAA